MGPARRAAEIEFGAIFLFRRCMCVCVLRRPKFDLKHARRAIEAVLLFGVQRKETPPTSIIKYIDA